MNLAKPVAALLLLLILASNIACSKNKDEDSNTGPVTPPVDATPPAGNIALFDTIEPPFQLAAYQHLMSNALFATDSGLYAGFYIGPGTTVWKLMPMSKGTNWLKDNNGLGRYERMSGPLDLRNDGRQDIAYVWTAQYPVPANRYGINYLNKPTIDYRLKGDVDSTQPRYFDRAYIPDKGQGKTWGIQGGNIWREDKSKEHFKLVWHAPVWQVSHLLPDPDDAAVLWFAVMDSIYATPAGYASAQIHTVFRLTDGNPADVKRWQLHDFAGGFAGPIVKLKDRIYLQKGAQVLRLEDNGASVVSPEQPNVFSGTTFCSNGQYLFSNNGNYYDPETDLWKPYIGSGKNLNGAEEKRFYQLKALLQQSSAIHAINANGRVYIQDSNRLISIQPIL